MKFKEIYFHTVAIACSVGFLFGATGVAEAQTRAQVDAVVTEVVPKYTTQRVNTPRNVCTEVDVPIYGKVGGGNHDKTGDVLTGAILGGIIGNNIGNGKGNGAAGAVIGGLLGNAHGNNRNHGHDTVVGYRKENRCTTEYDTTTSEVFLHNVVIAKFAGITYQYTTTRNVAVGQTVQAYITVSPAR